MSGDADRAMRSEAEIDNAILLLDVRARVEEYGVRLLLFKEPEGWRWAVQPERFAWNVWHPTAGACLRHADAYLRTLAQR